jgi:predicted transcriptional regulator
MIITKHGYKRIKERLGLPKRAQSRHIKAVLAKGALMTREGRERFEMVYHGFLYIFALTPELEPILVTTFREEIVE